MDNKNQAIWSVLYNRNDKNIKQAGKKLGEATGLSEITSEILISRGYDTKEKVESFIKSNDISALHDPFLMKDIDKAVDRIRRAVADGEKITVYGDYDVDGVTSVTLMYLYLKKLGADVSYYIPSRSREGYGLSDMSINILYEQETDLIITVDTGITANEEAIYAKSLGIDMVITDHHECREELPDVCAVVNIHRNDCMYPFKELAGVGVVFKLLCAYEMTLCREQGIPDTEAVMNICREYLDLTAIGTIADVMPLIDENRIIVNIGLGIAENTKRPGLEALIEASSNSGKGDARTPKKVRLTSSFIGYGIAPRINAAGRMCSATKAVELLLSESRDDAVIKARELCDINLQRQIEENRIAEQAHRIIDNDPGMKDRKVIVLADDSWQQGIVGIVASRITEKYGLPSILISFDGACGDTANEHDIGKGSGRSIKGMNLVSAMNSCSDLLVRYGGHELAAGLSIERRNIDEFCKRINEYAGEHLDDQMMTVRYEADCEVCAGELTMELATELNLLEPFGVANQMPLFILRDAVIKRIIPLAGGKHLKFTLSCDNITMSAIWFGVQESTLAYGVNSCVDVLFRLSINDYQNIRTVQLIVQDIRESENNKKRQKDEHERYNQIYNGAYFSPDDGILPSRDDIADIYRIIRRECNAGRCTFSEDNILTLVNSSSSGEIGYVKFEFVIRILSELNLCEVSKPADNLYIFGINCNVSKKNLDKSFILKKLKGQCRELCT